MINVSKHKKLKIKFLSSITIQTLKLALLFFIKTNKKITQARGEEEEKKEKYKKNCFVLYLNKNYKKI